MTKQTAKQIAASHGVRSSYSGKTIYEKQTDGSLKVSRTPTLFLRGDNAKAAAAEIRKGRPKFSVHTSQG